MPPSLKSVDFTLDRRVILWESPLIREIGPNGKDRLPRVFWGLFIPNYRLEGIKVVAKRAAIPIKTALAPDDAAKSPARAGTINWPRRLPVNRAETAIARSVGAVA